jgi:hypothetical protein
MPLRRWLPEEPIDDAPDVDDDDVAFDSLHWLAAGLFLAAGTEAGLGERRGDVRTDHAVRWGPLIAAPLAGGAHAARALFRGRATGIATRVLNGVAFVVGAAGVAGALHAARDEAAASGFEPRASLPRRLPSFAPLTFAIAGLVGVLIDREEAIAADRMAELREQVEAAVQRARLVDRLVPKRKPRLDRIVLHV